MVLLNGQMAARVPSDPFLNNMDASIFLQLAKILDISATWRKLIEVLPKTYYDASDVPYFEQKSQPSFALLQDIGNKGVTVSKLITYLEELQLERALVLIKDFDPVKITQDLPSSVTVRCGPSGDWKIECQATGFPRPLFQWFKYDEAEHDWIDLIEQNTNVLNIQSWRPIDAGLYCCRATNSNPHTGNQEPVVVFTSHMAVKVDPPAVVHCQINKVQGHHSAPAITLQPISPSKGKVIIGASLCFKCGAKSDEPVTYEWFMNGDILKDEENSELRLENVQPVDGKNEFNIQCRVSNSHGSSLSHQVTIFLTSNLAPCTAEDKVALLIGNQKYEDESHVTLNSVIADVTTLASLLLQMDFKVLTLINLEKHEMYNAVDEFCKLLDNNVYGFFYYAGHGFQQHGQCYMLPVDATAEFGLHDCVCVEDVETRMQIHDPALCCLFIDMCRKELQTDFDGKYTVYQPKVSGNRVRAYSTTYSCEALDGAGGKNGLFMKHLKKYIGNKTPISDVLDNVRRDFNEDPQAIGKQYPEISSNLSSRRSLTDKIMNRNPSYDSRQRYYKHLTSCLPPPISCPLLLGEEEFRMQIDFEAWDEVVHNVLEVRLSVMDAYLNQPSKYIATIQDCFTTENEEVACSILDSHEEAYLTYVIENLQKIRGSIFLTILILLKWNGDNGQQQSYSFEIGLPLVCQARLWQRRLEATEEAESGFESLTCLQESLQDSCS